MVGNLFEMVQHIEESINKLYQDVCVEIERQRCWLNRMRNGTASPSLYAICKLKIYNSNERLSTWYKKSAQLNNAFRKCYNKCAYSESQKRLYATPLPFLYDLINSDYKRIRNYLRYMKLAAAFSHAPDPELIESYKGWLNHNWRIFNRRMANRYTKFLRINAFDLPA